MKHLMIACLTLLFLSYAVAADCLHAQTQLEMNQCTQGSYKAADKTLNRTYQDVLKKTKGKQTALLKKSQHQWIEYRDTDCKFQSFASEGGSINQMVIAQCLESKTVTRTNELKKMLNCPEGDVSCPL